MGIEVFSGVLSGDGTEFWAPCDNVGPSLGYGVRLIRLCFGTTFRDTYDTFCIHYNFRIANDVK